MSGIATGTAIAIAGGAAAVGGVATGVMGMEGANAQADAATQAAQLQFQAQEDALNFEKQQWNTEQANIAPWLKAGTAGITELESLLGLGKNTGQPGFGSLAQPWTEKFVAPTAVTEQNDPGYQFRLKQGLDALQNSAAARGGLLSGGTAKQLEQYSQDFASNEYQNVYNRALGEYQQRYNIFENNQANLFNRLGMISGVGQTATGQLGQFGASTGNSIANILLNGSQAIGNSLQNAAAARASGYAALGNAFGGGLNNLESLLLMNQMGLFNNGGMNSVPTAGMDFYSGING